MNNNNFIDIVKNLVEDFSTNITSDGDNKFSFEIDKQGFIIETTCTTMLGVNFYQICIILKNVNLNPILFTIQTKNDLEEFKSYIYKKYVELDKNVTVPNIPIKSYKDFKIVWDKPFESQLDERVKYISMELCYVKEPTILNFYKNTLVNEFIDACLHSCGYNPRSCKSIDRKLITVYLSKMFEFFYTMKFLEADEEIYEHLRIYTAEHIMTYIKQNVEQMQPMFCLIVKTFEKILYHQKFLSKDIFLQQSSYEETVEILEHKREIQSLVDETFTIKLFQLDYLDKILKVYRIRP